MNQTNVMSELTIPVSMDKMIECMLDEMNNDAIRFNSANAQLIYEYQKSLRKGSNVSIYKTSFTLHFTFYLVLIVMDERSVGF